VLYLLSEIVHLVHLVQQHKIYADTIKNGTTNAFNKLSDKNIIEFR